MQHTGEVSGLQAAGLYEEAAIIEIYWPGHAQSVALRESNGLRCTAVTKSLEALQAVVSDKQVVHFVAGAFERLGVQVRDTGESFTCLHRQDRIDFEEGAARNRADYTVEVESNQLERLSQQVQADNFDEIEKFRLVRVLFTPATAAMLEAKSVLSQPLVRKLAGVEDLIHVRLCSPMKEEEEGTHTLIYAAGQWLVLPGLHGRAKRTFTLSTEQALDYQRHIFAAVTERTMGHWLRFGLWYRRWRKQVSRLGIDPEASHP